jgi:hypothetical protein
MGRGAQAQTRQLTDQQLALQNQMNQQLYGQNQSLSGTAAAGYENLLANPGYSDAEKSAITNQSMGALASTFAALASSAANRVARTRNSSGYGDLLDALAQEQGRQTSSLAQQNQLAFANQARQDQLTGLQGLSGLYGVNSSLLGRALGIPANLLSVRANASRSGTSGLDYLLGQGIGTLGKILG